MACVKPDEVGESKLDEFAADLSRYVPVLSTSLVRLFVLKGDFDDENRSKNGCFWTWSKYLDRLLHDGRPNLRTGWAANCSASRRAT